jgi:hypothetical protein
MTYCAAQDKIDRGARGCAYKDEAIGLNGLLKRINSYVTKFVGLYDCNQHTL